MEGKMDDWSRFHVLVEVAEEERIKCEKEKEDPCENERKLRGILSKFLKHVNGTENGNSSGNGSMAAVEKVDLSIYHKGKKSERKKISSQDELKKLIPQTFPQFPQFEGKHLERDGSVLFSYGDIFKKSSKRPRDMGQEVMPRAKKVKKANAGGPISPLPEAFKSKIRSLGGSESQITFVFQKELTMTDVNPHQAAKYLTGNFISWKILSPSYLIFDDDDLLSAE